MSRGEIKESFIRIQREPLPLGVLHQDLSKMPPAATDDDAEVRKSSLAYINDRLLKAIAEKKINWDSFLTFWPPRMIEAFNKDHLTCFFGAGLSIPSGLPSWAEMLRDYFGLDQAVLTDDDLKSDPLTQAELASHRLGADKVQSLLREKLGTKYPTSTNHYLAAALRLPFYVTTNYDVIFRDAWNQINNRIDLVEITSDIDISRIWPSGIPVPSTHESYLFKIHGCLSKETEHLILTRSDYRRHYRSNDKFFSAVRHLLASYHVLFLGFSHKDPEVTRLVEDAIWQFEKAEITGKSVVSTATQPKDSERPHFYSLQFSMNYHTPEIFAARGIVALHSPLADPTVKDFRSSSLSRALSDLIGAAETGLAQKVSLDQFLEEYAEEITSELRKGLAMLSSYGPNAYASMQNEATFDWMEELRNDLAELAGQGVYLINHEGKFIQACLPKELTNPERRNAANRFGTRPYFQQAKTYREPFVSDCFRSIFNDNTTFSLCFPLVDKKGFAGLLFSACQPGAWKAPLRAAAKIWDRLPNLSILVVDANGVAVIPPNGEFNPEESILAQEQEEDASHNIGFPYRKLLSLSRRNKLIERIMENVIPLRHDDDVLSLGADLRQYTVLTEIPIGRWKIGISDAIFLSGKL
jgi:hypothetical protein